MGDDSEGEWIRLDSGGRLRGDKSRPMRFPLPHHPMDVRQFLLRSERETEYYTLLAELAIEFPPVDLVTSMLVERLGQQIWSLRRYARAELLVYRQHLRGRSRLEESLKQSMAFRERAEKASLRTIKELQRLQKERTKRPLSREAQVKVSPENILEEYSQKIEQPEDWWQEAEEFLRNFGDRIIYPE